MSEKIRNKISELELHANLFEPNLSELVALKKYEDITFEEIKTNFISEGRQSRVSVLEYKAKGQKNRVIWKRMGANKNLTNEEANTASSHLLPYQKSLRKYGWTTPELYHSKVLKINNEHQIFSYEEMVGRGDAEKIISDPAEPNFKKWYIIRQTLEKLSSYPGHSLGKFNILNQELTLLPHGLDLKPANIVSTEDRGLFFVDLFGPKLLDKNGQWQLYLPKLDSLSEENLLAVCATREGSMLRFMRLSEWFWTKAGYSEDKIRDGIIEIFNNLNLPEKEKSFISSQIKNNYSWLDQIYAEKQI